MIGPVSQGLPRIFQEENSSESFKILNPNAQRVSDCAKSVLSGGFQIQDSACSCEGDAIECPCDGEFSDL